MYKFMTMMILVVSMNSAFSEVKPKGTLLADICSFTPESSDQDTLSEFCFSRKVGMAGEFVSFLYKAPRAFVVGEIIKRTPLLTHYYYYTTKSPELLVVLLENGEKLKITYEKDLSFYGDSFVSGETPFGGEFSATAFEGIYHTMENSF